MNAKTPEEELVHYRRVLSAWHWMSELSEHPDEVIRLLEIDSRKLLDMADDHPSLAGQFLILMDDYNRFADEVRQRTDTRRQALTTRLMGTGAAAHV